MKLFYLFIFALALGLSQPACVVVGGYSDERGWFIWPGSFVFLVVAALLLFYFLRRRR
jgi:hypothetical protein